MMFGGYKQEIYIEHYMVGSVRELCHMSPEIVLSYQWNRFHQS